MFLRDDSPVTLATQQKIRSQAAELVSRSIGASIVNAVTGLMIWGAGHVISARQLIYPRAPPSELDRYATMESSGNY